LQRARLQHHTQLRAPDRQLQRVEALCRFETRSGLWLVWLLAIRARRGIGCLLRREGAASLLSRQLLGPRMARKGERRPFWP